MTSSANFFTTRSITDQVRASVEELSDVRKAQPDAYPRLASTALALLRAMIANPADNIQAVTQLLEKIRYLQKVSPKSFSDVDTTLLSTGESLARLGR